MLTFDTELTAPNGKRFPFHISVDITNKPVTGEMIWDGDGMPMKRVRSVPSQNSLYFQTMWLGSYNRAWILASKGDNQCTFSIRLMGSAFDYTFDETSYLSFLQFLSKVQSESPMADAADAELDFDAQMDGFAAALKQVNLYAGSNFHKNLAVQFTSCSVNESPVGVSFPRHLPQGLGVFLPLGMVEEGAVILIKWTIDSGDTPTGAKLSLGAFRNTLRDRTVFETIDLMPYHSYKGSASLTV